MKYRYGYSILLRFILVTMAPALASFAQETNSRVMGSVSNEKNEILPAATITLVYEPSQNTMVTLTANDGFFYFSNLRPGGPYSLSLSSTGYQPATIKGLYLDFNSSGYFRDSGENQMNHFVLQEKANPLEEVILKYRAPPAPLPGSETTINNLYLNTMPSISRNLQDLIRLVPQSRVNGDGMMSLAGQNNKFNSFFIDGANNNDILGIALSGTNGGQTGSPPVSIEALEEINVLLSPYDVQYGNFTGGSINAITRSGSNTTKSSAWYFFRNEKLAGRSPAREGNGPGTNNSRLPPFFNQTAGAWISGPVFQNKLFYFLLVEKQAEKEPQVFDFTDYRGNSTRQQLNDLADTLRKKYAYDPGSFLETKDNLEATRTLVKLDWNPTVHDKFTLAYRYNFAEKQSPQSVNSSTVLRFQQNGFVLPERTHAATIEWKKYMSNNVNRLC